MVFRMDWILWIQWVSRHPRILDWPLDRIQHVCCPTSRSQQWWWKTESRWCPCQHWPWKVGLFEPKLINFKQDIFMSSMIPSARPTIPPVAEILKSGNGWTDGRATCVKLVITAGRNCGLAKWINKTRDIHDQIDPLGQSHSSTTVNIIIFMFC